MDGGEIQSQIKKIKKKKLKVKEQRFKKKINIHL